MPWKKVSPVEQREEFVRLALAEGTNISALCRRFGIARSCGYKWIRRFRLEGPAGLLVRSRRPHHSPNQTASATEAAVLRARDAHPAWGGRKLRRWLLREGVDEGPLPAPSVITGILRRHGRLCPHESAKHRPYQRFEHDRPNALWQMDFKGHFPTRAARCHPLTVLDDHSRYAVALRACPNEQESTVQDALTAIFRRYGLPERLLVDNGSPWGTGGAGPHTAVTVWLLRLGIAVARARPYHPQTLGKDERFHRTLKVELLAGRDFADLAACQRAFDHWRHTYNHERPHEALGLDVPISRYRPSARAFPDPLPPIEYDDKLVRTVQAKGKVHLHGRVYRVPSAFRGYPVALRPTRTDGLLDVYFCTHKVAQIDLSGHDATR